jgi:hypothetical protein
MSAEDKKYQARRDAETLADAHGIMSDRGRLTAAQKHAKLEAEKYAKTARIKPLGKRK